MLLLRCALDEGGAEEDEAAFFGVKGEGMSVDVMLSENDFDDALRLNDNVLAFFTAKWCGRE